MPTIGVIAAIGASAASATAGIYGANKQSQSADKAAVLQSTATDKATALATSQEAERKSEFDQQQAQAKAQWDADQLNKAPARQASADAILRVRDLIGLPSSGGGTPSGAPLPSTGSPLTAGASPSGGSAADLKALIDSGLDPQQAATQFNKKYGRSTGNEAQYYAPSAQTSGKAVIGLPDAYLSQEPQGWAITQRGAAPSSAASSGLPKTAMAAAMPPSLAAQAGTGTGYAPIIPFSQLMSGVR